LNEAEVFAELVDTAPEHLRADLCRLYAQQCESGEAVERRLAELEGRIAALERLRPAGQALIVPLGSAR
jgi:hypothetical protein